MRTPPLPADFIHPRACKPICAKSLTLPRFARNTVTLLETVRELKLLGINGFVTTEVLEKICVALECQIGDVMEIIPEENYNGQT